MTISKNNYEAFFLDYHEGNLTPQLVAELLLFVELHPELKEEFESYENFSLDELPSVSFENKSLLKKEITIKNKDEYFIRSVENTLNTTEQELLSRFLEQHPQFINDLELFRKTKIQPELSVVFGDKDQLKDITLQNDHLLIAAMEGLLTAQESVMFNRQLETDAEMQQNYELYCQTRSVPDTSVVFEDKASLRRRERRIIPLYYYIAAAAAIAVLFGLSVLFRNPGADPGGIAAHNDHDLNVKTKSSIPAPSGVIKNNAFASNVVAPANSLHKNRTSKDAAMPGNKQQKEHPVPQPVNEASTPPAVAQNSGTAKDQPTVLPADNNREISMPGQQVQTALAPTQPQAKEKNDNFLSLGEIAAAKIKQKTLSSDELSQEKKAGRLHTFSGWNALQVIAKGVSKLTGRDVEVKPTYNDEGEVTAYAFNAGKIGFSKER